jgi:hypothetical protein
MNVKIKKYEHARITAPMAEREKVFAYIEKHGWRLLVRGRR